MRRGRTLIGSIAAALIAVACGSNGGSPGGVSSDGGVHGNGTGADASGGGVLGAGDDGPSFGEAAPPGSFVGCATDTQKATLAPLDLFFMMDTSGSMNDLVATGRSKWNAVVPAMDAFVGDPASAGIGVGLQYFPLTSAGVPASCTASAQCGTAGPCVLSICNVANGVFPCDTSADCGGLQCLRVGQCQYDHNALCYPGSACGSDPNGFPLGACQTLTSSTCVAADSCTVQDYATPAVPIAPLPGVAAAVSASLAAHQPQGNTPTAAALEGAIVEARAHAAANPGHTVAAVLATDGIPDECNPSDIPSIAGIAAAGFAGNPSVETFAIGVFTPDAVASGTSALNQIAKSGGTGTAFIINSTSQNVEQQFSAALTAIRGAALPCEYRLPAPADGGIPDFTKLNVQYTSGAGAVTTVAYVHTKSSCSAAGGWYYDVDPAEGGAPTTILVCPATCSAVKGDAKGRVDVVLGCRTVET